MVCYCNLNFGLAYDAVVGGHDEYTLFEACVGGMWVSGLVYLKSTMAAT